MKQYHIWHLLQSFRTTLTALLPLQVIYKIHVTQALVTETHGTCTLRYWSELLFFCFSTATGELLLIEWIPSLGGFSSRDIGNRFNQNQTLNCVTKHAVRKTKNYAIHNPQFLVEKPVHQTTSADGSRSYSEEVIEPHVLPFLQWLESSLF